MQVKTFIPPGPFFFNVELDKITIDYLWELIDKANAAKVSFKNQLIGNISESLMLEDKDNIFYRSICEPLVTLYRDKHSGDPVHQNTISASGAKIVLNQFWVNYQYETEFNPYHDHAGVYSFVVWLKIPYDWQEQKELPQFRGTKETDRKPGNFEFQYLDILGNHRVVTYPLSEKLEGTMVFFPARLRHCVYPFFGTTEARISVSGNLSYKAD